MTERSRFRQRPATLVGIALLCLVIITFFPVPSFEFVGYDVRAQVIDNPALREVTVENVVQICTSPCLTSYYPVRTLTYMVDYQIWGPMAGGFKATNCLIHFTNVLLLFWLALRLLGYPSDTQERGGAWPEVAAAGLSAGVFAVHPVVVEPVVWVAGREELLMTLGALGAIHLHITARLFGEVNAKKRLAIGCHVGAALCCAAACLSNAVGAVIPALITGWDLVYLRRPKLWKILRGTAVLWIIGVATVIVKVAGGATDLASQPDLLSADRLMLVANVYWLNLGTLVWPARLGFDYPLVTPASFWDAEVLLGVIAVGLTLAAIWLLRQREGALFGLLWFVLALVPSSQVMGHHIHRADRFLYLPLVGLALAVSVGWMSLRSPSRRRFAHVGALAFGLLVLILLETRATRQVWTWQNEITACENSLQLKPGDPVAHCALADRLVVHGRYRRAAETYREAMSLHPEDARIQSNYAWLLASCEDEELLDRKLAIGLATQACQLSHWKSPEFLHTLAQVYFLAAEEAAGQGESDQADELRKKGVDETLRMALLLQSGPKSRLRDPNEALLLAERACGLTGHPDPEQLGMLAEVYAEAGRFEQAAGTLEKAIDLCPADGNPERIEEFKRRLNRYRSGIRGASGR
jgi:tetratricopeptide (TPR) repeat protein